MHAVYTQVERGEGTLNIPWIKTERRSTYFLSATYMLLIWSYTAWIYFFFNLRGGKCPCCTLAGFTAYGLNTPTNKMLTLEAT